MPGVHTLEELAKQQIKNFGLNNPGGLNTTKSAEKFLQSVGIALRYWSTPNLPLASLYQAAWGTPNAPPPKGKDESAESSPREEALRKAIGLTNHLLASHQGIEVNVIGKRLALVHRDLVPTLYVAVRNHRPVTGLTDVTPQARKVFHFMEQQKDTTAGAVRKFLGIKATDLNNDPAYQALAELQSRMLVDRGPFIMEKKGIPYLSKEGYPYHCFHRAHKELVSASAGIRREDAVQDFLCQYLKGAAWVPDKKLFTLFNSFLSRVELEAGVKALLKKGNVSREEVGKVRVITFLK
jgi:hypothetical protein